MMVCQICMLRLLHDVGTIFTISRYKLCTLLCLIVMVNMEFYIIEIIAHEFVSDIFCTGIHFVSSPFCWHYIFGFLSVSTYVLRFFASQICSPFTICRSFLVLNWKVGLEPGPTYLSWSNMFFHNCYPCNQITYQECHREVFWACYCSSCTLNKLIGYADDSTLMAVVPSPCVRVAVAESLIPELGRVSEWCGLWGMNLNARKTKTMIVSRSRTVHPSHPH